MRLIDISGWPEKYAELTKGLGHWSLYDTGYGNALNRVDDWFGTLPTINPEDLRSKGAWLYKDNEKYYWYECSVCGEHTPTKWCMNEWFSPFCPNCGAKMESTER